MRIWNAVSPGKVGRSVGRWGLSLVLLSVLFATGVLVQPDTPLVGAAYAEPDADLLSINEPYVTNRKGAPGRRARDVYTGERGEPHFGRCRVEFTPNPVIDQLAPRVPFHVPSSGDPRSSGP
jgi:hypothetical protein